MIATYRIKDFFESEIKLNSFHINKLEEMPPLPKKIKSPHKHAFIEVFLVLHGSMDHNVDFNAYQIKKNHLFFISEGQYHFWAKTHPGKFKGFRLMFEENFLQSSLLTNNFLFELIYLNNVYQNPLLNFSLKENKIIVDYFNLLHAEYERKDFNVKALQANLFLLLLEIQRIASKLNSFNNDRYHLKVFQNFTAIVDKHFNKINHIDWYANELNITQTQLNRIVRKFSQDTVSKFILNRRILEAKRLLVTTSLSNNEISYLIGIEDPSYFIRLFKKVTQFTPQEFRSKM